MNHNVRGPISYLRVGITISGNKRWDLALKSVAARATKPVKETLLEMPDIAMRLELPVIHQVQQDDSNWQTDKDG
jgi:hypothetical protein